MPITRSARKKLRQDRKREKINLKVKETVKKCLKNLKRNPSEKLLQKAFSLLDQAAKKKIFHKRKVARLKSRLSKLLTKKKETIKTSSQKISPKKSSKK